MTNPDGSPIWYELMTGTPDRAREFYAPLMGWSFGPPPGGAEDAATDGEGGSYTVFTAPGGAGVGGIMPAPGRPATWAFSVGVADVDAMADRVSGLGGRILLAPRDVPGAGRLAFVADPQGATFYLMRGEGAAASTAFAPGTPGHCSWNELVTTDQDAALAFYAELLGWHAMGAMPMEGLGDYTFVGQGERMIGAMMNGAPGTAPFWNFAFGVSDIDRAARQVAAGGGRVRSGPVALPGEEGDWMIQIDDPSGGRVMLTGPRIEGGA